MGNVSKLFFVAAMNYESVNLDLFVEAYGRKHAERLWAEWVQDEMGQRPPAFRVFAVPALTGKPGKRDWFNEVKEVSDEA